LTDTRVSKRLLDEIGKGMRETAGLDAVEHDADSVAFGDALPLLLRILGMEPQI
jgi:hypothetical protein